MKNSPNRMRDQKYTRTILLNEETVKTYDELTSKSETVRNLLLAAKELEHPDDIGPELRRIRREAIERKL